MFQNPTTFLELCATVVKMFYVSYTVDDMICVADMT